jgi:hypothetical protein
LFFELVGASGKMRGFFAALRMTTVFFAMTTFFFRGGDGSFVVETVLSRL